MTTKNQKIKNGYSLLETVIYIALFSMLSIAILSTIDISSKVFRTARVNNVMLNSGNTALERISRSIRSAKELGSGSVFGSSSGVLELINGNGTSVKIDTSSGMVRLTENGIISGNLTGQSINVDSLLFRRIDTLRGDAIKTELILSHSQSGKVEKFQTTTILRNSY